MTMDENENERGERNDEVKSVRVRVRRWDPWNPTDEPPPTDLTPIRTLTRERVEAVCREYGPDHAWIQLGVSRSTLYKWRRDWRKLDAQRAALDIQGDQDGYPGTTSIEEEEEPQ